MSRSTKNCCAKCFGDPYLGKRVIQVSSSHVGNCCYCRAQDQSLVRPQDLREQFEFVLGAYKASGDGQPLLTWLRDDWRLFDPDRLDDANANALLADILDDGNIVRERFLPADISVSEILENWNVVRTELKHQNRFFPTTEIDLGRIENLLPHLQITVSNLNLSWYRARIQGRPEKFDSTEMGAPPKELASHGRANPAGIPYLYLASDAQTAVSELRPHPGELASVAQFDVDDKLSLVDLREPRTTVSPFSLSSESEIQLMRDDVGFLEHLGEELTRPVVPDAAAIDYIPSQYLCEFIKHRRFDGVLYRSSVGHGTNLALFQPNVPTKGDIESVSIDRVIVEMTPARASNED